MSEHGTRTRYYHHGCRCADCVKANSEYLKEYRLRTRGGVKLRTMNEVQDSIRQECEQFVRTHYAELYVKFTEAALAKAGI